jgi:hypothetical protein
MKLHVAYDQRGRILAAAEQEADQPAEMPGLTVAEIDVPPEFEKTELSELLPLVRVDVAQRRLRRAD